MRGGGLRRHHGNGINHPFAGEFFGNVQVHGDVFLAGEDCAENFELTGDDDAGPGDVVVISASGGIRRSTLPDYRAVAGEWGPGVDP